MRFRDALREIISSPALVRRQAGEPEAEGPGVFGPMSLAPFPMTVRTRDAMFSVSYLACELAKARPISTLPVHVYEKDGRKRVPARDPVGFYLQNLLDGRWNPTMKSVDAIRWVLFAKDTLGAAYVRVEWGIRQGYLVPVALWPLMGGVDRLWDGDSKRLWYRYVGDQFTDAGTYRDEEIVEFKSELPGWGTEARSLADAAATNIGLSIDLEEFYQRLLTNGTHMPVWFETDERLTNAQRKEFVESINDSRGIFSAGRARLFENGIRLKQSPASLTDLNIIEEQRWVLQQMCRITGVPPNEVYEQTQTSYSGNVEQTAIQFASKTLVPECRDLEAAFDGVLRSADRYGLYVKWDMNGLMRGLYESRMKGYQIGVFSGIFSRNEPREWEELDPLPGLDKPLMPVNYYTVAEDGSIEPPPKIDGTESDGAPGAAGDIPSEPKKSNAVLDDMRARIRARVADRGDTPKTREFAFKVLAPWAALCIERGDSFDIEAEIEELMRT